MPIIQRYSNIKNGGIVLIGNTLDLSKAANANAPGVLGSIGAFTSTDMSLQVNGFPAGTTLDYTKNSSSAQLSLPPGVRRRTCMHVLLRSVRISFQTGARRMPRP